jgi:hypothetical protein
LRGNGQFVEDLADGLVLQFGLVEQFEGALTRFAPAAQPDQR